MEAPRDQGIYYGGAIGVFLGDYVWIISVFEK